MSEKKTKAVPAAEEKEQQVAEVTEIQGQQTPDAPVEKAPDAPSEQQEQTAVVKCRVNSKTGLNLRPEPSKMKPALRILSYGAEVEVHGEPVMIGNVTWLRVENGWCDSTFLTQIGEEE